MASRWQNVQYQFPATRVLVTGGTSGIGAGIAAAYRDAGAQVTITGTRASPAEYEVDYSGYGYLPLDVEDNASIDRVAAEFAELDILVHSAGVALYTLGLDENDADIFERSLRVHLSSVHRLAEGCRRALSRSGLPGGASMTCIASMSSFFAFEQTPAYGAAKTGLVGLTRQLAVRFAKERIRVNALAVGLTRSRMTSGFFADRNLSEPMLAGVPLGRHGAPSDIAGAALFLSSDAASWITGQTLPVDGGFTIKG